MRQTLAIFTMLLLVCASSCTSEEDFSPSIATSKPEPKTDEIQPVLRSYDFAMDTVKLNFSESVELLFIKSAYGEPYDVDIMDDALVKYSADSTSIKFRCLPCQLGGDYSLQYSVADTAGNVNLQQFSVKYYSAKLAFPLRVSDYLVDDESGLGYVISLVPNKLTIFSLASYQLIDEISLNFLPSFDGDTFKRWMFTLNPLNQCLYIYSVHSKSIFVFSLQKKMLTKVFELPAENINVPEYSSVYPKDIAFTGYGNGLINTVNQWGNGGMLRRIYSSRDDTTQVIGGMDAGLMFSIQPNGDNSKLFVISEHAPFYFLEGVSDVLSSFSTPAPETNFTFFVPNRKNDLVYMSGHQAQFIIDAVSEQRTSSSYLGLPVAGDFSYADGEERDLAYLVDDSKVWLLDYQKRRTVCSFMIKDIANVESLVNTVDGTSMIIQHREALYLINLPKLRRLNL